MDLKLVLGWAAAFRSLDLAESSRDGEHVECFWSPFLSERSHEDQANYLMNRYCRVTRGGECFSFERKADGWRRCERMDLRRVVKDKGAEAKAKPLSSFRRVYRRQRLTIAADSSGG